MIDPRRPLAAAAALAALALCVARADEPVIPEGWKKLELKKWSASCAVPKDWVEEPTDVGDMGAGIEGAAPDEDGEAFFPTFGITAGKNLVALTVEKIAEAQIGVAKAGAEDFKVVSKEKVKYLGHEAVRLVYDTKMFEVWTRTVEHVIALDGGKKGFVATFCSLRDEHDKHAELQKKCFATVALGK